MADKMALIAMFEAVSARFAADSTAAPNRFGFREQDRQIEGAAHRSVVWVPGDDGGRERPDLSNAGTVRGAQGVGGLPRSLATLDELCTVYCWATDVTSPESEPAQYTEARLLWDAWYRAMHLGFYGNFKIQRMQWVIRKRIRNRGLALRTVFSVGASVPDKPLGSPFTIELGPTGDAAGYDLTVDMLDQSEHITKDPI